ncbi:MAG: DUF4430 domain-containing protein [Patescibacteria group bacterium]|jgi:hypothetical protein
MKHFLFTLLLSLIASPVFAADYIQTNIRIETATGTVYAGDVYLSDIGCSIRDTNGTRHVITGAKAVCALKQAASLGGFAYDIQDSSYGLYLTSLADQIAIGSDYWSFIVNYTPASVGLADYTVQNGDEIILSLGGYPNTALQLKTPNQEVLAGNKLTVRVKADGQPVVGAKVHFGDVIKTTDNFGKASYKPNTLGVLNVYADNTGSTRTYNTFIRVMKPYSTNQIFTVSDQQAAINSATQFLSNQVGDNGLVNDSQSLTEWTALALAKTGADTSKIQVAVLNYDPTTTMPFATTEIARHILAVQALGFNARNINGVDYVARLLAMKNNHQFGDEAYVNDDIFAGLALTAVGEDAGVAITAAQQAINTDGGLSYAVASTVSDVDTTAYYVQLLNAAGDDDYGQTVRYLRSQQNLDGGWGYTEHSASNSSSTAVVIQALNVDMNNVRRNHRTGYQFLQSVQAPTGVYKYDTFGSNSNNVLNSSYALLAMLK